MYYNVVIKDSIYADDINNELIFTFFNLEDALTFVKNIMSISNYSTEILYIEKEKKNE